MDAGENLSFDKETMRRLGYRAVDIVVDHFESLPKKEPTVQRSRKEMEKIFREPIPQEGSDPFDLLNDVEKKVFGDMMHLDHPRFFAFISSPSNYMSVLADFLSTGHNVFMGTWLEAAAPIQIEIVTVGWLCKIFGLPETSGGLFLSGGSVANLTALVLASHFNKKSEISTVYCSNQTHSSMERAVRVVGQGIIRLRKIETNSSFQIDVNDLEETITNDIKDGLRPICIVGNAGTTNTGAIDDLKSLKIICDRYNTWFHVDAAFGGVAILDERCKAAYDRIELADSITTDPHKWFFQPFETGCLLVKDQSKLKEVFQILPEYLKDAQLGEEEINYCNHGVQLTRSFRAFKLWLSLKTFGLVNFKKAIAKGIRLGDLAEKAVLQYADCEVLAPARLGTVNFRFAGKGLSSSQLDELNQSIINQIVEEGFAMVGSTILNGKKAIRLCIINPRTTEEDVLKTIEKMNDIFQQQQKP